MCAFKDELQGSERSGEEPTEMTAMTSGESRSSSSTEGGAGVSFAATNSATVTTDHRKAWFKRLFKSPKGKCILGFVIFLCLGFASYVVSKIVVGSMYMKSCQLDPFIPIYLVVSASLLITFILVLIIILIKCHREDDDDDRVHPVHLIIFVYFFIHLVLQLAGSVCVIRSRNEVVDQSQDPNLLSPVTCDGTLLNYAFGVVIFELILSGLFLVFTLISLCEVTYLVCCRAPNLNKQPTLR